jgi:hypothetical protein
LAGTILVTGGTGRVGSHAVNFLSRSRGVEHIVFVGRDQLSGDTLRNNTVISAALEGFYPKVEFRRVNLREAESTIQLLKETRPDVILNSATTMSMFPFHGKKKMKTGGYFIIRDLAILYPFMKSVKKSRIKTQIVNVANPDNNHYILSKAGLDQLIGAGTIDLTVQGIKYLLSERLEVPMHALNVSMISHVTLRSHPPKRTRGIKVPYYVKIMVGNQDITDEIDVEDAVSEGAWRTFHIYNKTNEIMTAASAVRNTLAILNDTGEIRHSAGVNGMVGGIPVRLGAGGAEPMLPEGITWDDAFKMNSVGMNVMGIEKVKEDGTIVFTDQSLKELENALGLSWKEVRLEETTELADRFGKAYKKMIAKLNP